MPDPNQTRDVASAGMDLAPPASAAMSVKATEVIQPAPKTRLIMVSATKATIQDCLVSTEATDGIGACMCAVPSGEAVRGQRLHTD